MPLFYNNKAKNVIRLEGVIEQFIIENRGDIVSNNSLSSDMALILKKIFLGYNWIFEELADSRPIEMNLFLMSSTIQPTLIILGYFYFVYNLGPRFMENRKPFDLKNILLVYNFAQIIFNAYIVYEAAYEIWYHMNWSCQKLEFTRDPHALHIVRVYHFFMMTKLLDLLDTVFFVLRKRQRQISFLHVYHHSGMFILIWITVRFVASGYGTWVGLINGFVHVIMYSYYFLSSFDNKWKNNLALKKFITQVQLIQFATMILIYGRQLFIDCEYPKIIVIFFLPQNVFMFILFSDFYRKTYLNKPKKQE